MSKNNTSRLCFERLLSVISLLQCWVYIAVVTNCSHHRYVDLDNIDIQLAFIILAGIAACCYFLFLLTMVVRVFRNILAKKSVLPSMSKPRRNFYLVSRVYFMCCVDDLLWYVV